MNIKDYIDLTLASIGIALWLYLIPYLVKKGWEDAKNKTLKVCNTCFRDIEKFNEFVENKNTK